MISELSASDFNRILEIINDAAEAYKGVIPDDRWHETYMSEDELRGEIDSDVRFYGWFEDGVLMVVMGIQIVRDATLIRHAYVLTKHQRRGIGSKLLEHLIDLAETKKMLVGTWKDAFWVISFYDKHSRARLRACTHTIGLWRVLFCELIHSEWFTVSRVDSRDLQGTEFLYTCIKEV